MPSVAILVPVIGRPHKAAPFMESFRASGAEDATVYVIAEHDDPESIKAWEAVGAKVAANHSWRTFAEKINFGYKITKEDWIFLVGDDVVFHPGWLETALASPGSPSVIGIKDREPPREHVGHMLIKRDYIDRYGASWDGPGVVCHPGYRHMYVDNELLAVARRHGAWYLNNDAYVEHIHPHVGKAAYDPVYLRAAAAVSADYETWMARRKANMRVGVYGIALNEASNVRDWAASAKDADYIILADTGSTDNTVSLGRGCGVKVLQLGIRPFRFDAAHNAAIAALPLELDWCISLDLDERLQPGWRDALLKVSEEVTRVGMWFVWEKKLEQMPEGDHWHRDCHRRTGYRWNGIVHEALEPYGFRPEKIEDVKAFQINHVPDEKKPRAGKYIDMIKMAILEDPKSLRYSQWLVWSLDQEGRTEEAAVELKRQIASVLTWEPAIADAMTKLGQHEPEKEQYWLEQAVRTASNFRSYKAKLAMYFYQHEDWANTLRWADEALAVTEPPPGIYDIGFMWTATIHELRYMALFSLNRVSEAFEAAQEAQRLSPEDKRIAGNIRVMRSMLQEAQV